MTADSNALAKRSSLWVSLIKLVALVTGVVATIILRPPALYDQNLDAQYAPLMNVVGAVLLLFMMVLSKQAAQRVGSVWTSLLAVCLIIAAVISLIAYLMVARTWSCTDGQGLRLVIGADYLPEAVRDMRDNGWTTCTEIIDNSAGALQTIWKDSEITSRFFKLFAWFVGNAVLFMTAIFLAIEAALLVLGKDLEGPD